MGRWVYRKREHSSIRGICVLCGKNPQKKKGQGYKAICSPCDSRLYETPRKRATAVDKIKRPYRRYLKESCEKCGFLPIHTCQLDVDHIDGNHKNNAPENLQTLCANCHRLKTYEGRDWEPLG